MTLCLYPSADKATLCKQSFSKHRKRCVSLSLISRNRKRNLSKVIPRCLDKLKNGVPTSHEKFVSTMPLTVLRNGQALQYVWNNGRMQAIVERTGPVFWDLSSLQRLLIALWSSIFPSPEAVNPDYWPWIRWRLLQRFFATALTIFGTQSLLMAAGIEARRSLTASIAINWMVKDGVGRIARLLIATKFSKSFDTDLKRARILSMSFFAACVAGDFLTPVFPKYFLLLAAVANIGKAAAVTAFVATASPLVVVFAKKETIADLTAKLQAQYSVVDSLAIAVAALSTYLCRLSPLAFHYLPFVAYGICTFFALYTLCEECKTLIFRTMNENRLVHVAHDWVNKHTTSSPEEISVEESSILSCLVGRRKGMNVKIGRLEDMVDSPAELSRILQRHEEDAFLISLKRTDSMKQNDSKSSTILITFREGHQDQDAFVAFLTAAYAAHEFGKQDLRLCARNKISTIFSESVQQARDSLSLFRRSLVESGWKTESISIRPIELQQRSRDFNVLDKQT